MLPKPYFAIHKKITKRKDIKADNQETGLGICERYKMDPNIIP